MKYARPPKGVNSELPPSDKEGTEELIQAAEAINPQIFREINKEEKRRIAHAFVSVTKSYSGPLPDPDTLQGFEDIVPGAAERIFTMAEKEQDHRHETDNILIRRQLNQSATGQWMGFFLGAATIFTGRFLVYCGQSVAGIATIIGAAVALVALFVSAQRSKSNRRGFEKSGN